ncbi:MAG: tetratricopeptide repeat protein [Deltaproteobacteria bacterium]|nr:tetratricopeptide repeat protein [Deltaproteobacteria bacterium]
MRRTAALFLCLTACPDRPLEEGQRLEAAGRFDEAGEVYLTTAKDDPANLAAWDAAVDLWCRRQINVGQCMIVLDVELQLLGTLDRHQDALAEVLELRARARLEQGMTDAAWSDLVRAEKAAPKKASVLVAMARVKVALGQSAEAEALLDRAKRLDPKQAEADELLKSLPKTPPPEENFGGPSP